MPAQLVALSDGASYLLDKPILLVGRHPEADLQIDSRKISRLHCCIAQVSDYLVVRDLGSTNGVRINGVRVVEGKLHDRDELTIGNFRYTVRWDEYARKSPTAHAPAKELGHPVGANLDDEALESSDEPVPLAEGKNEAAYPVAKSASKPPIASAPRKKSSAVPLSSVLPEKLELAPSSDSNMHPPTAT